MKVELFQKMDMNNLNQGMDLDEVEILDEFFLTTTLKDVILSKCEIGKDEAKLFANYCETGEVQFVGEEGNSN